MTLIQNLIDKQDGFELIRDQIAAILKLEISNQKTLASSAGKNPDDWDIKIYSERSNPLEDFQDNLPEAPPVANVWFESENYEDAGSNTIHEQKANATYNIDCYSYGTAQETAEGHTPGDLAASLRLQRTIRLIRNILMSSTNTYLQLRGFVWRRQVESITIFQPAADDTTAQNIIGARIVFRVTFNESSPQYVGEPLELLSVKVVRAETGEILLETEYQYGD